MHSIVSSLVLGVAGKRRGGTPKSRRDPSFEFRISLFALFLVGGCGAPGDPTPPSPPVPVAIADLTARQAGDGVELTFTMPSKTIRGERLAEAPTIEILRGSLKPDGTLDTNTFHVVYTIPGSLANTYLADDHTRFIDPVSPQDTRAHPGGALSYGVRTRASRKRASAISNSVSVRVFPVPERIAMIQSNVAETFIDLSWAAPTRTSGGDPLSAISEYRVYRGEFDSRTHDSAAKDISREKWITPLVLLAAPDASQYRDTQFDFGKSYVYVVRTVIAAEGKPLESSDSEPLILTPVDTFPPAPPQGVIAAVLANPGLSAEVDLSWSISAEADLAGYRVYRSTQENEKGQPVTPDLLLSPAYRDTPKPSSQQYWYRVTAVDRSGNESAPTPPVVADLTQHSP